MKKKTLRHVRVAVGAAILIGFLAPETSALATGSHPDKGKIAVTRQNYLTETSEVWTMNPDGSGLRRLSYGRDPAWSPMGDRLLYWHPTKISEEEVDETPQLYMWSADTNSLTYVTEGQAADWSPEGAQIAYGTGYSSQPGPHPESGEIYVIPADGSAEPINLTNDPAHTDYSPSWAPDGERIAFVKRDLGGVANRGRIYIMDADGANPHPLTTSASYSPSWSPDGRRLAFEAEDPDGGDYEIFTARADGSHLVKRTGDENNERDPAWTKDGKGLIYSSNSARANYRYIYLSKFGESDRRRLTCDDWSTDMVDWWSPDVATGSFDYKAAGKRNSPTRLDVYKKDGGFNVFLQAPKGPCEPPDEDCVGRRNVLLKKNVPGRDRVVSRTRTHLDGVVHLGRKGNHGTFYVLAKSKTFTSPEGRKVECLRKRSENLSA
jgi:TolB protein